MKGFVLFCCVAVWLVVDATAEESIDPRSNPRVDDALKQYARYHCYYKCHQNPDSCSVDARRDLYTCETLLYWVYFTNYETCMHKCHSAVYSCQGTCDPFINCQDSCLRIAEEKVRTSTKTPDELIHTYFTNRESGRQYVYIGE